MHKGFKQKDWIDYFDTYVLLARITSTRASFYNIYVHQIDVNADPNQEIHMEQPERFGLPKTKIRFID